MTTVSFSNQIASFRCITATGYTYLVGRRILEIKTKWNGNGLRRVALHVQATTGSMLSINNEVETKSPVKMANMSEELTYQGSNRLYKYNKSKKFRKIFE